MYSDHFGLQEVPFSLTPDTRFFYAHHTCQVALNTLMVAIRSGEGFTKVTGEVGTGKTLLCRKFLSLLGDDCIPAYIPNPYMEPMTMLSAIADELGVKIPKNANQHQLLAALTRFLIGLYDKRQKTVVICIDDAHTMPIETLEALRLLSNLETQRRKLLQLVLFGQPELDIMLARPEVRQLKQRISFSAFPKPMDIKGIDHYVNHRLNTAGYQGPPLFSQKAIKRLYKGSHGIPRLINILAHKALMCAYGTGEHSVNHQHVKAAIADTEAAFHGISLSRSLFARASVLLSAIALALPSI